MNNKNYAIEFWRFFFCCIIIFFHAENSTAIEERYFINGYYCVEFFFILSGFLLMKSIHKMSSNIENYSIKTFAFNRIKRFAPVYYFSLIITFLYRIYVYYFMGGYSLIQIKTFVINALPEFFMINGIFYRDNHTNGPDWYISALIICEIIIFIQIKISKNFRINVVYCLIANFIIFGYIYYYKPFLLNNGILLFRGLSEISLGMITYLIYLKTNEKIEKQKILLNFLEIISILSFIYIIFSSKHTFPKFYIIIPFTILIFVVFSNKTIITKILNNSFSQKLGLISYPCFLIQMLVLVKFGWNPGFNLLNYPIFSYVLILFVDVIYAIGMMLTINEFKRRLISGH